MDFNHKKFNPVEFLSCNDQPKFNSFFFYPNLYVLQFDVRFATKLSHLAAPDAAVDSNDDAVVLAVKLNHFACSFVAVDAYYVAAAAAAVLEANDDEDCSSLEFD